MSERFRIPLPEGTSRLTIIAADALSLRGSERYDVSISCDESPQLETGEGGPFLRLSDDADIEIPAALDIVIAQLGDALNLRSMQGQVRVGAAPDDVNIKLCSRVTLGRVQGDLSAHEVEQLEVESLDDDASLRAVQSLAMGPVGGDLSVSQCGQVRIESVEEDLALSNVHGPVTVGRVGKNLAVNNVEGHVQVESVGRDAVVRGRALAGQQISVRAWGEVALVLSGPLMLRRMEGRGAWSALPTWKEIKSQAPNPAQAEGAEALIAAGRQVTAASYDFDPGDLSESLSQLGAQLSGLGTMIVEQVRSSLAAADFEGVGRQIRDAMADVDWSGIKRSVRAAERTQQQAERVARQAERRQAQRPEVKVTVHPPPTPEMASAPAAVTSPAAANGSISQERLLVLQMIEQGKITPEQGEMLLDALPA